MLGRRTKHHDQTVQKLRTVGRVAPVAPAPGGEEERFVLGVFQISTNNRKEGAAFVQSPQRVREVGEWNMKIILKRSLSAST